MRVNWAKAVVILMATECICASVAYFYQHNWKLGIYWLLAGGINAVVSSF